jgi:hypothetical protein
MSKTDVAGKELAGAKVQVLKAEDKSVVAEWTSTTTPHEVTLSAGSYLFHEVAAPKGYQIATDIVFTIAEDGTVTKNGQTVTGDAPIVMVDDYADKQLTFSKQDTDGNELAGASMELQKEDGTVVEQWTSDGTTHTVTVAPGTYKLVETAAPKGYTIATTITVTVSADGTITKDGQTVTSNAPIVMVDDLDDLDTDIPDTPVPDEPNKNIVPDTPKDDTPTPSDTPKSDTPTTTVTDTTPTPTPSTTTVPTNPKTGDTTSAGMWITLLAASLIGVVELAVILAVVKHKRNS